MFRLTLDHRRARKSTTPQEVFDLGAGPKNCVDCIARTGPSKEIGYCCSNFVDAITGASLPAVDVRTDENACGMAAVGFAAFSDQKAAADPSTLIYDPTTGDFSEAVNQPAFYDAPISDDPIIADARCGGACADCAHSFMAYFDATSSDTFCARVVSLSTRLPLLTKDARGDVAMCGPDGAWFEPAPPMTLEEERILAQGGSTFYHW